MLRPVLDVSHFLLRQEPFGSMMFPRRLRMCTGRWIAASRKNMKESGRMHRKNRWCFLQISELKLTQAAQQRAWAWQFWEVCVLLRSVRFGFWIGLQDLQESFVWCCHPLLGDELQVWGVDRLVLFSWKIAGKLWNQQGERRSNILNDLFCVCLKTHIPSFWNPAKSAFWSFAGHWYKYIHLPLPASGTTMQWWPQTCRGNPFSESSQPFSTTSSSRVSKKSIIDLKDRLLRLIHASLDANLQSSILL